MKVTVYKLEDGRMSVLIESTPGKGRAPVLLQGITQENVSSAVLGVVTQLRRPKGESIELPL